MANSTWQAQYSKVELGLWGTMVPEEMEVNESKPKISFFDQGSLAESQNLPWWHP